MKERIESRLKLIEENLSKNNIWHDIETTVKDLYESLKDQKIFRKIELNPNDTMGGSVSFHFTTHPPNILLKLWHDSGNYYISLYKKIDNFDHQITNTFNELGILTLPSLDEFEERILDFIANEIANRDHRQILD